VPSNGCERQLGGAVNGCASAIDLGTAAGDSSCNFLCPASGWRVHSSITGYGGRWYYLRVAEVSSCIADLHARLTLAVPAAADYDLYVYSSCGTLLASSKNGTGLTEWLVVTVPDSGLGVDNSFDLWIEVRYFGGTSCGGWTLTAEGTDC
jgi:hypothetical protein